MGRRRMMAMPPRRPAGEGDAPRVAGEVSNQADFGKRQAFFSQSARARVPRPSTGGIGQSGHPGKIMHNSRGTFNQDELPSGVPGGAAAFSFQQ